MWLIIYYVVQSQFSGIEAMKWLPQCLWITLNDIKLSNTHYERTVYVPFSLLLSFDLFAVVIFIIAIATLPVQEWRSDSCLQFCITRQNNNGRGVVCYESMILWWRQKSTKESQTIIHPVVFSAIHAMSRISLSQCENSHGQLNTLPLSLNNLLILAYCVNVCSSLMFHVHLCGYESLYIWNVTALSKHNKKLACFLACSVDSIFQWPLSTGPQGRAITSECTSLNVQTIKLCVSIDSTWENEGPPLWPRRTWRHTVTQADIGSLHTCIKALHTSGNYYKITVTDKQFLSIYAANPFWYLINFK